MSVGLLSAGFVVYVWIFERRINQQNLTEERKQRKRKTTTRHKTKQNRSLIQAITYCSIVIPRRWTVQFALKTTDINLWIQILEQQVWMIAWTRVTSMLEIAIRSSHLWQDLSPVVLETMFLPSSSWLFSESSKLWHSASWFSTLLLMWCTLRSWRS